MATISVSLPSDGQTADAADYNTPITTIVNEINGNLDNDNIAASAGIAGSKLADAGVSAEKLATSAITLGYAQSVANFNNALTTYADVTGLSVTVTVPAGGRRVKITGFIRGVTNASGTSNATTIVVREGTTDLQSMRSNTPTGEETAYGAVIYSTVASAGSHTYKVSTFNDVAANVQLNMQAGYPGFILVELI